MPAVADLIVPPGPGAPDGVVVPQAALHEKFIRATGPGGQGVNTTDSRVQLTVNVRAVSLTAVQRSRLERVLAPRLVDGRFTIEASEHRAQRLNRRAARARAADVIRAALVPPPPPRKPVRPSKGAMERRLRNKRYRAAIKAQRALRDIEHP